MQNSLNSLNIPVAYLRQIMALSPDQLRAIRLNIQDASLSDDQTRAAMIQAVADGYEIEDFLPEGPRACAQDAVQESYDAARVSAQDAAFPRSKLAADREVGETEPRTEV